MIKALLNINTLIKKNKLQFFDIFINLSFSQNFGTENY